MPKKKIINPEDGILEPGKNTGVIIDVRWRDFFAGGETGAAPKELIKDGNFDAFLPDEETQYKNLIDVFACVSFSALNSLESVFNYLLSEGLFSVAQVKFLKDNNYIDKLTGKVNFSDRFTAKMSGTTKNGNSLGAVGDSIRKNHGLIPESLFPWPKDMDKMKNADERWNLYYQSPSAEAIALGKKFLEYFAITYQWIVLDGVTKGSHIEVIESFLKYGPVQIAAQVCSPWNSTEANPPIKGCGCGTQHATIIYGSSTNKFLKDFDSYKSYRKKLAWDYCIPYAVQYYVAEKAPTPPGKFEYTFTKQLRYGMGAIDEVHKLQEALQFVNSKNNVPYMKSGVFGAYGPQTREALALFQTEHGIYDPDGQGMNFGPQTRTALNEAIKSQV